MKGLGCRRFSVSDSVVCLILLKFRNGVEKPFDEKFEAVAIVAGGAEMATCPIGVAGFSAAKALSTNNDAPQQASRPWDKDRDGFVLGDGAGVLVLEDYDSAKARNAKIYAELTGFGMSGDAHHMTAPPEDGAGAASAMANALNDAKLNAEQIGYINAHGTSTPMNDKFETIAMKKMFGEHAYGIPISSTKSMHGHLLGAAGALEAIMCIQSLVHGIVPPTINQFTSDPECDLDYVANNSRKLAANAIMSNSFGFGGHNASLVFTKYRANNQSTINA